MQNFHDAVIAIQAIFSKSSLKSALSNFTVLGGFLKSCSSQGTPPNSYDFMKAYLKSSQFFRWWFKSYIDDKRLKVELDNAIKIFKFMQDNHIFDESNFTAVASHANPRDVASVLQLLSQANILTQDNFIAVASHANARAVAYALER